MMTFFNVKETNIAVCKALGLNASDVQRIDIVIQGGKMPTVTVEFIPSKDALLKAVEVIENASRK